MKKRILVISGGISKERIISLDTGRQVAKELTKNGYNVKISESLYSVNWDLNLTRFFSSFANNNQ